MLTKESEGIQIGTKLLALHIQSSNETEALQALAVSFFPIFVYIINLNLKLSYYFIPRAIYIYLFHFYFIYCLIFSG